jgi:hypothetical protein
MVDAQPGPGRPVDEAHARRWWSGPRSGDPSYGVRLSLAIAVAALLTACLVALALLLDSHARRWLGPVVFGCGILTVVFYGWAIYSTVRPVPVDPSGARIGPVDNTEPGGAASEDISSP